MTRARCIFVPVLLFSLGLLWGCGSETETDTATAVDTVAVVEEPELIKVCAECHRKAGRGDTLFWPHVQGKSRAELVSLLRAYREERLTSEKMNKVAHTLTDEDISQLADFYAR